MFIDRTAFEILGPGVATGGLVHGLEDYKLRPNLMEQSAVFNGKIVKDRRTGLILTGSSKLSRSVEVIDFKAVTLTLPCRRCELTGGF